MRWKAKGGIAALALLAGCAVGSEHAAHGAGLRDSIAYEDSGLAAWYGAELAGRPTANGERFDPDGLTAAHRTLPLGTWLEVTSLENGRSVVVRVNDRGPYHGKRILDLSRAAARRIGMAGQMRVRLRRLDGPPGASTRMSSPLAPTARAWPGAVVRVATFVNRERAEALADRLDGDVVGNSAGWRVLLGPFKDPKQGDAALARAYREGFTDAGFVAP